MVLTRQEFVGVVKNAVSGIGLAPDIAMVTFPTANFLPSADLSPVGARKSEFYDGLTKWVSTKVRAGAGRMLSVEGETYEAALNKANELLIANLWATACRCGRQRRIASTGSCAVPRCRARMC